MPKCLLKIYWDHYNPYPWQSHQIWGFFTFLEDLAHCAARRRRHYSMTELENDDEWCLRFIICPRCLCDAIKRWRPVGIAIVGTWAYGNVRILWLHSVICWAESTFYLSLSMGRWVVNSRVGLPCSAGWMGGCTFDSVLDLDFRLGIFKLSTNLIPEQKGLKILFRLLLAKLLAELTKIGHIFRK